MGKMMSEVNDILDKLKIQSYDNEYYWRARDIQFLLENCNWEKLQTAILRIKKNCEILSADRLFRGVCVKFYFTISVLPVISAG